MRRRKSSVRDHSASHCNTFSCESEDLSSRVVDMGLNLLDGAVLRLDRMERE